MFPAPLALATGCYSNIKNTYPGAISISVSAPGWYGFVPKIGSLSPKGFKNDPIPSYVPKYMQLLSQHDPREIINQAAQLVYERALQMGYDDDSAQTFAPVLLCWERPGQFCHRRLLADWITSEIGIDVPEVKTYDANQLLVLSAGSKSSKPAVPPITQTLLF